MSFLLFSYANGSDGSLYSSENSLTTGLGGFFPDFTGFEGTLTLAGSTAPKVLLDPNAHAASLNFRKIDHIKPITIKKGVAITVTPKR